jgi:hypothetical protein
MRGESSRYWVTDYGRSNAEWSSLLHSHVGFSAQEGGPNLARTADGATAFHLTAPTIEREIVRQFKKLSGVYRVFNNTFTFEYDSEAKKSRIVGYRSANCSVSSEIRVRGMKAFVERHKFGDLHHYDMDEWSAASAAIPFGLLVVKDGLEWSQKRDLLAFSEHSCGKMQFGWASFASETEIGSLTSTSEERTPFLLLTNHNQSCNLISQTPNVQVIQNVIAGDCKDVVVESSPPAPAVTTPLVVGIVVLIFMVVLVAIPLLRRKRHAPKFE